MNDKNIHELLRKGPKNTITDVPGVRIGHSTIKEGNIRTGATAIIPAEGNVFKNKLVASAHIINGFGKSAGLMQIQELGAIETPILLTNTLSVGTGLTALTKYMLDSNEDIGVSTGTVNSVVCECNDGKINQIRSLAVKEEHFIHALQNASDSFQQGDVGAGTGMVCYGLKGGIGSSSRRIVVDDQTYTLGVLVLSNFGSIDDFVYYGKPVGKIIGERFENMNSPDNGSIIVVLATDTPMDSRQLSRVLKRTQSGIARTGGYTGNGSGEIAVGFTTANRISHYPEKSVMNRKILHEDYMDIVFLAAVQATEEAILNSMMHSNPSMGVDGIKIHSLKDFNELIR
ncbi:DmpA family aminopeptidase [Gudongella sp. SC589]|jgi:D-aminopeptidase|uniref:DmpA family aminopeptidase n=1 Tax=Gudongella sp. SC589 TaxID=3385990 RepID=UPI003904771D